MSVASQAYAPTSISVEPYHPASGSSSPLPSPSTPGLSRWKSVFKIGGNKSIGKGSNTRPTLLTAEGGETVFDPSNQNVTRIEPVRAHTSPGPIKQDEERDESSGSSYNIQLGSATNAQAVENDRPYSEMTEDTDRSSRSSGSRQQSSNPSPMDYRTGASSASLHTTASSITPHRGLGFGFKSRIFSTPEASTSFLTMSPRDRKGEKRTPSSNASSRKKSGGSSTSSNQSHASSPKTPRKVKDKSSPEKQSAAARFLRRVVSAPNTKALLANTDVPPLPTKSPKTASPVVVINDPSEVDLTTSPTGSSTQPSGPSSPATFASTPSRPGGLSATGTRGARSLTASAASKKDAQAALGLANESHHKQVFRRTYSSNSIKTRSVEVSPSSFQKIKLLGKGDVGKVYLVREKKTDKLFAMKGETSTADCADISPVQEGDDQAE